MKKLLVNIIKFLKNPRKHDSKAYTKYLKKRGVIVGKGTYFFDPVNTNIDISNGIFISIGEYCKITSGVRILAHDFSYSVLRRVYHDIPKKAAMTIIGNNVFIGINSIILLGAEIGDNSIIGAGSVVSGKIPSNEVWGGNPARFICTLDEYYKKCKDKFETGAFLTIKQYKERLGRNPNVYELQYFSSLFRDGISIERELKNMQFNGDSKEEVLMDLEKNKKKYNSMEEFFEMKMKEE